MTSGLVISNASPIIGLAQINQLHLLEQIFGSIAVPPAVVIEVSPTVTLPDWIWEHTLSQSVNIRTLRASLGPGESEAISLALENETQRLILDDRPARRLAQALSLPIIGTLGVLLAAKQRGLLLSIRPSLDRLVQHDFHIAPTLYDQILRDAQE